MTTSFCASDGHGPGDCRRLSLSPPSPLTTRLISREVAPPWHSDWRRRRRPAGRARRHVSLVVQASGFLAGR